MDADAQQPEKDRKTRSDKAQRKLNQRALAILIWIAQQYAIRLDQLRELLSRNPMHKTEDKKPGPDGLTMSAVRQVVAGWEREPALVQYQHIHVGSPGWVWLTPYGLDLLHQYGYIPKYARHHLRESRLSHRYYINAVRLNLEKRHPDYYWESERTLLAGLGRREEGDELPHTPDAIVWQSERDPIAVEVELSPKDESALDTILFDLLTTYKCAWYFVRSGDPVHAQARRAVEAAYQRLPLHLVSKMQVIDLADVVSEPEQPTVKKSVNK